MTTFWNYYTIKKVFTSDKLINIAQALLKTKNSDGFNFLVSSGCSEEWRLSVASLIAVFVISDTSPRAISPSHRIRKVGVMYVE